MHGSALLDRQSIQCDRDLLRATPGLQLLLKRDSGSGGIVNDAFDHPLCVTGRPKLRVQHPAFLP
jgi:hypothetical protein